MTHTHSPCASGDEWKDEKEMTPTRIERMTLRKSRTGISRSTTELRSLLLSGDYCALIAGKYSENVASQPALNPLLVSVFGDIAM